MRKTAIAVLALALTVTFAASASATVFFSETFAYPDGPLGATPAGTLNPITGWYTHSGTAGGGAFDIQVVGGALLGNHANAPDDSRPFAPGFATVTGATDKTYSCMRVTIIPNTAGVDLSATQIYFAHFKDNIPTGTTFTAKIFVQGVAGVPSQFKMGISNGPANTPVYWGSNLTINTEYIVATRFDAATGIASLWINPADESSTSISGTDTGATGRGLAAYGFRQSTGNWSYRVDDLRTGTSFGETCGGFPTPANGSTWGRLKTLYR